MRYLIIILCIILTSAISTPQDQIKAKRTPKKKKETEKAQIQQKPQIDYAAFQKSLAPIDENILTNNQKFLDSIRANKGGKTGVILKNINITQRTDIRIADDADAIAVLNPIDPHTLMLSRYTSDGALKWNKNINFSSEGYDLAGGSSAVKISNDGKITVVYGHYDHANWIIGVYDEQGNLLIENKPYAHFAPSGHYFYGYDPSYSDPQLQIYDSRTFQSINIQTEFSNPQIGTQYTYKIFGNDMLVMIVAEMTKESDIRKRKVTNKTLVIYDLKNQRTINRQNLLLGNDKSLYASISSADLKGSRFICPFFNSVDQQSSLFIVNIESGQSTTQPIDRLGSICLSSDGNYLFMFHGLKSEQKSSLVDLKTNKTLFSGRLGLNRLAIEAFSIHNNTFKILQGATLSTFSMDGMKQQIVEGWFNLKHEENLILMKNPEDPTKTTISVSN